jgi:predicted RNA-binding Zn-ribbon protein involved in translation (DUF1610 family)
MVIETTLRRGIETTVDHNRMQPVRCAGHYKARECNRLLAWLDGAARLTCPRCGLTQIYRAHDGRLDTMSKAAANSNPT